MDRLTKKVNEPGALPVPTEFGIDFIPAQDSQTYYRFMKLVAKLWDYENTGMEPDQIQQIIKASENMMFENVGDFVRYSIANFEALEKYRKAEREKQSMKLPCKIGDTCWAIKRTQGGKRIFQTCVSEMYFDFHMNLIVVGRRVCRGHIGKDIFLSFEEAHAFLENENRKEEK